MSMKRKMFLKLKKKSDQILSHHLSFIMFLIQRNRNEYVPQGYEKNSDFCKGHFSLQPSKVSSTSYNISDIIKDSNVDVGVKNQTCVVDLCHKKIDLSHQPLEGVKIMEDLLCDPHHLIGSLNEDKYKLMEAMNKFVETNTLVTRCCWKYSRGEQEGESFLEEFMALKYVVFKMKESYIYQHALKRELHEA